METLRAESGRADWMGRDGKGQGGLAPEWGRHMEGAEGQDLQLRVRAAGIQKVQEAPPGSPVMTTRPERIPGSALLGQAPPSVELHFW